MMWFWILLAIAMVVLLIPLMNRSFRMTRPEGPPMPRETPLEILEDRYARGEINHEEFERRKRQLES